MYYRNDLIPSPPKNWDELTQLLAGLNKEGKSLILDWGSLDWIGYSPFLWQAGGDFYSADYSRSALESPEAIKALTFFTDLYRKYKVPQSGQTIAQGLRSGSYPLGISGSWLINSLPVDAPEIQGKWSIAMLPQGPSKKRTAFIGGRAMGIFNQSKMQNEGWEFLKFLSQPQSQKIIYEEVAKSHNIYMPPNISTCDILPIDDQLRKTLVAQALDAQAPPPVLGWNDSTRFIVEAIQKSIVNGADPALSLKDAAQAMNERLSPVKK
jgi:multiple sugar transport system substrate-binding protein